MLKKIVVDNFMYKDLFGEYVGNNVEIRVDSSDKITSENFDQNKHKYYVGSSQIKKIANELARSFYLRKYKSILEKKEKLSPTEIRGVMEFLSVNQKELSDLIGVNKGQITKWLKGLSGINDNTSILLMKTLGDEIENPGKTDILLKQLNEESSEEAKQILGEDLAPIDAEQVAEYFISYCIECDGEEAEGISNLKLQKLLYYAQGRFAALYKTPLLGDNFLAWKHGPVIRRIYGKYAKYESQYIPSDKDANLDQIIGNKPLKLFLNYIYETYGKYSAWKLRNMTHSETPWLETKSNQIISIDKLQAYFQNSL